MIVLSLMLSCGSKEEELLDPGAAEDAGAIALPDSGLWCVGLADCCPKLEGDRRTRCENTVSAGDELLCEPLLDFYSTLGECADRELPDVGVLGPECVALQLCCPGLGALEDECFDVVALAGERACKRIREADDAGMCTGPSPDAG